jgi:preprotein translocase subunit SecE
VARQTRSERRARRAAQAESRAALERAPQQRVPQQQQQQPARPTAATAHTDGHHVPGRGATRFISESWGELKKVDWPGQQQLVQGTAVVLIACLVTGVYLFLADELFRRLVQHVLLGG